MKTAVLISGQLRTFAACYPTQRWHVYRHFRELQFFVCVQAQENWAEILAPLMADYPGCVHVELKGDPDLSAHLTPQLSAAYHHAPYANAAPAHQLLLQHWYQRECWKYFIRVGGEVERYGTIIRMRGDNHFKSFALPAREPGTMFNTVHTPWWGRFSGLNDRFAIMGNEAAAAYFNLWDSIPALLAAGAPFHPETLLRANLERENVNIREDLKAEFSTLRPDGKERWPEITSIDIAHAALRAA